ncbi:MAG: hypothetical protein HN534_03945 [Euryarchaeota archaeon]|jgi:hypothetical protein|nr:hypothetical protein [Euryarchaeota archaeon]MBT3654063.1 hypothetical protein [Euryarchaeota archaeon]MBT3757703.1 hypothetical protein [Euryarchaeota archaeon]MBT4050501.1 hypothetical protein [Euryarchaeota archaeon]MBT4346946.1 hypothetical protein [Euryarchaeota archaeon]
MASTNNRSEKLRAVAIAAIILHTKEGKSLEPTKHRQGGSDWAKDHRRNLIGRRTLSRARSRRSTTR